ncbi:ATP-dependent DNA helicase RecG [Hasllibacter halocynthiae]|uniref:ATP-dependent DNA helicase RecG n=1 Tax=Hasllibacter halocynthiae TaxID=595589 RepID=A0A2T0X8A6_9RHOB|nr:ATP-dependent DNA helicase RecG [Hasllibacter halocynthiae]PRY95104.1 ATP-dependent DNA helicase RecG [Hasllibacter halocynthiae]
MSRARRGGGRPEILWPLFAGLEKLDGIGPKTAAAFERLRVESPRDLLFLLPSAVIDRRPRETVQGAPVPSVVTVEVTVIRHHAATAPGRPDRVHVRDAKTEFVLIYFHARGDWLSRLLPVGERRIVSGRLEIYDGVHQMAHPDYVLAPGEAEELPRFEAVYPMADGITKKAMAKAQADVLSRAPDLPEWVEPSLKAKEGWPGWHDAILAAHAPEGADDVLPDAPARRRLAYDEIFAHQLTLALVRREARARPGRPSDGDGRMRREVLSVLPYAPTGAQQRAMDEIAADMADTRRMNRLLQGDVGAGKTLVALMALLTVVEAGGQGVLMAPTGILAQQHMQALAPLADAAGARIELLTGRDAGRTRADKLGRLENGDTDILVGTHAVFQDDVTFRDLRLVVVDEQHRFGVRERLRLGEKGLAPDLLVMTATPIPRSLSLAQYGDMDVSILDEKPPGRQPIRTVLIPDARYDEIVERLRTAVAEGRRAYWVCPLVEDSHAVDMTAATHRFERLKRALGGKVGLVHGQMPPAEKDAAMADFVAGRTQVLVATTVIEVGVDVPEATIMVIERADAFGLAQLHQLRGRVGRGSGASSCLLMYGPEVGETARKRLELLRETEDGFRIAEEDLTMRGAGDVLGTAQSGLPRFRIADLERQPGLMRMAQDDARLLLETDPDLASDRGEAARLLLWLMEQDKAIRLIRAG